MKIFIFFFLLFKIKKKINNKLSWIIFVKKKTYSKKYYNITLNNIFLSIPNKIKNNLKFIELNSILLNYLLIKLKLILVTLKSFNATKHWWKYYIKIIIY